MKNHFEVHALSIYIDDGGSLINYGAINASNISVSGTLDLYTSAVEALYGTDTPIEYMNGRLQPGSVSVDYLDVHSTVIFRNKARVGKRSTGQLDVKYDCYYIVHFNN